MKQIRNISLLSLILLLVACTEDFQEINTNPNAPTEVPASTLLRKVIFDYGEQMSYEGFTAGSFLGQYFTGTDFNLFDRGDLYSPQLGGNPWPIFYTNLRDNEILLNLSRENEVYAVYEGPAMILKAYMTAALTDFYGDVPYREAFKGKTDGITTPVYDTQQEIYTGTDGILDNLEQAITIIENYQGVQPLDGDDLLGGDLDNWKRFANSLRIKYLIRISGKVDVASELQSVVAADEYIKSNDQNAAFDFTASRPNNFRMANLRDGDFNSFVMSKTIEEVLKNYNDPRIEVFFRATDSAFVDSRYRGLLNGQDVSTNPVTLKNYSLPGVMFREQTDLLDANFMTAWETNFLLAEAALRGLITTGNAQSYYELGVEQAFAYWNTELPADYLTTGNAAYGMSDPMEQIITQKWLGNLINGCEGWIEYRRTGYPQFKSVAASLNNGLIPVRMPYPTSEEALNKTNYTDASGKTEGNSINYSVWWDE